MPLYTYKVKDKEEKIIEDVIQASNKKEAVSFLKADNFQILTIKKLGMKTGIGGGSISISEKAAFCRFLRCFEQDYLFRRQSTSSGKKLKVKNYAKFFLM